MLIKTSKTERIIVRMDPETAELLRKLAALDHETVSNYLRRLIRAQGTVLVP